MGNITRVPQLLWLYPMIESSLQNLILLHHIFIQKCTKLEAYHHHSCFPGPVPNTNKVVVPLLLQTVPHEWRNPSVLTIRRWFSSFIGKFLRNRRHLYFALLNASISHRVKSCGTKSCISNTMVLSTCRKIHSHNSKIFYTDNLPHWYVGLYAL